MSKQWRTQSKRESVCKKKRLRRQPNILEIVSYLFSHCVFAFFDTRSSRLLFMSIIVRLSLSGKIVSKYILCQPNCICVFKMAHHKIKVNDEIQLKRFRFFFFCILFLKIVKRCPKFFVSKFKCCIYTLYPRCYQLWVGRLLKLNSIWILSIFVCLAQTEFLCNRWSHCKLVFFFWCANATGHAIVYKIPRKGMTYKMKMPSNRHIQ